MSQPIMNAGMSGRGEDTFDMLFSSGYANYHFMLSCVSKIIIGFRILSQIRNNDNKKESVMKHRRFFTDLCLSAIILVWSASVPGEMTGNQNNPAGRDIMAQVSTIGSLMAGNYDGLYSIGELLRHGDFGLGTVHSLDGELIVLDGKAYQVRIDGAVHDVPHDMKTPFASLTWYDLDETIEAPAGELASLIMFLDNHINKDLFYAIRIAGEFDFVKTRSVTDRKPYSPLVEVVKTQAVFERGKCRGVLIDLYCPPFAQGINVPGHHFHFLSEDKTFGGHVLDLKISKATIGLDVTRELFLMLPEGFNAGDADKEDLERIEKGTK